MRSRDLVARVCAFCGIDFNATFHEVKRGRAIYCSHSCSMRARPHVPFMTDRAQAIRAHGVINARINRGKLSRPTVCQECGKVGRVDAHHDDYAKKTEVRWLCRSCHMKRHSEIKREVLARLNEVAPC